jgi:hypothetical protein
VSDLPDRSSSFVYRPTEAQLTSAMYGLRTLHAACCVSGRIALFSNRNPRPFLADRAKLPVVDDDVRAFRSGFQTRSAFFSSNGRLDREASSRQQLATVSLFCEHLGCQDDQSQVFFRSRSTIIPFLREVDRSRCGGNVGNAHAFSKGGGKRCLLSISPSFPRLSRLFYASSLAFLACSTR